MLQYTLVAGAVTCIPLARVIITATYTAFGFVFKSTATTAFSV